MKNLSYLYGSSLIKCGLASLLLNLSASSTGFGQTTYYVSVTGSDANTGRSEAAPFQTLTKVNGLSLAPGDAILFKRGDTFRGTLFIRQSGSADKPIVIDAYGAGNKPIIAGSVPVNNWTNVGNNTWQATCSSCGSQVTGLYRNGDMLPLGRYPNLSDSNKGYLTVQSHTGKTQLISQQSLATNWTGGELVVRARQWIMDRAPITQQSGNTLTVSNTSNYEPDNGFGFFIQNHPATLDQTGEWYYNPTTKAILLYDSQNDPNSQLLTVTVYSEGINLATMSYITVRNLQITQTLTAGIWAYSGNNLVITGNEITKAGFNGVHLAGYGDTILAENNLIEDVNNNGFAVDSSQNFTFRGNTVRRIGLVPGRGKSGDGSYAGVQARCTANTVIENNVVDNIGYNGISFANNAIVRNNHVSNFCLTKSDGGGIYTWNGTRTPITGTQIIGNIVYNGMGVLEGTPGGAYSGANGIFLDDCSQNANVSSNTTFNSRGKGIYLRGVLNITLKGNTSFNNSEEQLKLAYNNSCDLRGNVVQNNILCSKQPGQLVAAYESTANDLTQYGPFDQNYYVRPFEDQFKIRAVYNPGSGLTGNDNTLPEWQARWAQDANSFNSPLTYKSPVVTQTGTSLLNHSFAANTNGWGWYSPYGNGRIDWDNTNRLDGGSMKLSFTSPSNQGNSYLLATVTIGSITKGKTYQLLFDGVASGNLKRLQVYPRQQAGSYQDLAPRATYVLGTGRQAYDATFTATADESNAILVVQMQEDGQTVWVDNIRLQEVTAMTTLNPDDYLKLVYNPTSQDKVEALDGVYRDVKNTVYNRQVTVPAFSSVVLLKELNQPPKEPPVTLRDSESPANTVNGLDYQYYEGSWSTIPDFSTLTPIKTGTAVTTDLAVRNRDSQYGLRFQGYINVPTDGVYTFYTSSDDGSKLLIGTTLVVNNDGLHGTTEQSGTIGLKAGKHLLSIPFIQGGGGQGLAVSYAGPGLAKQLIPVTAFYRVAAPVTPPTTPPASSSAVVYLSDLTWASMTNGFGPVEKDRSNGDAGTGDGRAITLNGVTYAKGLGAHAASELVYNLGGQYTSFTTDMGVDDEMNTNGCGSVEFQIYLDNVLVYSSGVMNVTTATKSTTLNVTGKQTLKLVLTNGGDNYNCDHGDWAGARLTPVTSTTTASGTYLSDLTWASMTNGFGPVEKDRSNGDTGASDGRTITLNGVTYAKGLGAHASSELVYNLGGQYTSFTTDMGIDDETNTTGCGSVEFQIYLDNVLVYSSGVMNVTTATKSTTLNVTGKQTLKLVLTNGGDNNNCDHGDWAGARLMGTGSGRVATLDAEADNPELGMQVYPVPAREEVWVRYYAEAAGDVNLQLLNMVALPVMQSIHPVSQGENLIRMNVRELARGAYIMSLVQDKKRLTKKILLTE